MLSQQATNAAPWPPSVQRVIAFARARGLDIDVRRFPQGTRTAQEAARAVGCAVGAIVKSLVFVAGGRAGGWPVMALVSGANRADLEKLARIAGSAEIELAGAQAVREATGFAIGGVPPFGHQASMPVYVDRDLAAYPVLWAAAGTPDTVFPIRLEELLRLSGGVLADLKEEPGEQQGG